MPSDKPRLSLPHHLGLIVPGVLVAAAVIYAAFSTDRYSVVVLVWIAINALLAASLRFVMLIGEINMACVAFFGLGAYASAIATVVFKLPLPIAILIGAGFGAITSMAFGYLTLRTKGAYFLLIGFAFTEVIRLLYTQIDAIGANSGMVGIFPPIALDAWYPAITVLLTAVALAVLYAVERSTLGKLFLAIRGNERIVLAAGINVLGVKIACLAIASFMTGLAGALQAHAANVISPGDFGYVVAAFALAYVKIGGEASILGTVLGAAGLTVIEQYIRGFGALEYILFGGVIVAAMLFLPDGLYGPVQRVAARWLQYFRPSGDKKRASP
jgi:branched-chain amino acid transport system permease protein